MRLIPSDDRVLAYSVPGFLVGRAGTVRYALADGTEVFARVAAGQWVAGPVARVFRTGTTAAGLSTRPVASRGTADRSTPVPFVAQSTSAAVLLAGTGTPLLVSPGVPLRY